MKRRNSEPLLAASFFAVGALVLHILARSVPGFADGCVRVLNPVFNNTLGRLADLFPFSLVEILICGILAAVLLFLVCVAVCFFFPAGCRRGKRSSQRCMTAKDALPAERGMRAQDDPSREDGKSGRRKRAAALLLWGTSRLALLASVIFFLYEAGEDCGFYCRPFSERWGYGSGAYGTEELAAVCRELAAECNAWSGRVERDAESVMRCGDGLPRRTVQGMQSLGSIYPELSGFYCRPKGVLLSGLMSRTNMAGIFSAYTYEANYNRDMTPYNLPYTMSHELAHVKGIMQENEANFAAFLNCWLSDEPDLHYSGALSAWVYCGNELYKRDYAAFCGIYASLEEAVVRDLDANTAFWDSYRGEISKKAQSLNDAYLKKHGQSQGRLSYDKVVDLIVSWMRKHPRGEGGRAA